MLEFFMSHRHFIPFLRMPLRSWLLAPSLLLAAATTSNATVVKTVASTFTGDPLTVSVEIDDAAIHGSLVITLAVEGYGSAGDLRGFFAQVADESLLPGLFVTGDEVTDSFFTANGVIDVGNGSNVRGGGSPCPCDLGVEIGRPGIGQGDDFTSVSFTLSHVSMDLDVSLLQGQAIGVRVTSVGDDREGSSKLVGVVPEPSTAVLAALGLAGLASIGRGRPRGASQPD
jgi:hypothetical protein